MKMTTHGVHHYALFLCMLSLKSSRPYDRKTYQYCTYLNDKVCIDSSAIEVIDELLHKLMQASCDYASGFMVGGSAN